MLTILDRYILKKFLGTFFFAIGLIIAISVVFDISEKVDDFIEHDLSLRTIIFGYYIYFIPYFANLFSPLFIFVAVIFFTSRMAYRTEIVAILASGVSYYRMLVPYMVGAALLATMTLVLNLFIIPVANRGRIDFENTYINMAYQSMGRNQHYQIEPGVFIYFDTYSNDRMTGYKFAMERFVDGEMTYKLLSDQIRYDTTINKWVISNYSIRHIDGLKETLRTGTRLDTVYRFRPTDFGQRLKVIEAMNYFELNDYIAEQQLKGSPAVDYFRVEKYRRFSMPFAAFILTLMGVSLASRKVRGGIGMHIGLGILLSFTYIMFMQVAQSLATGGALPVVVAVWIPNIVFSGLAVWMMMKAPK